MNNGRTFKELLHGRTFGQVMKYNENHGPDGRFASSGSSAASAPESSEKPYKYAKTGNKERDYRHNSYGVKGVKKYIKAGQECEDRDELTRKIYSSDLDSDAIHLMELGFKNKDFDVETMKISTYLRIGEPSEAYDQYQSSYNSADDVMEDGVSVVTSAWLKSMKSVFFGSSNDDLKRKGVYEIKGIRLPSTGGDDETLIYPTDWAKKTSIKTNSGLKKAVKFLEDQE